MAPALYTLSLAPALSPPARPDSLLTPRLTRACARSGAGACLSLASPQLQVYHFLLTPTGTTTLFQTHLSASDRAMLLQRAAEHVSFNPRFVRIQLLGVARGELGTLPSYDDYGGCDAYCVCRLVGADGKGYPLQVPLWVILERPMRPPMRSPQ